MVSSCHDFILLVFNISLVNTNTGKRNDSLNRRFALDSLNSNVYYHFLTLLLQFLVPINDTTHTRI